MKGDRGQQIWTESSNNPESIDIEVVERLVGRRSDTRQLTGLSERLMYLFDIMQEPMESMKNKGQQGASGLDAEWSLE